MDIRDKIIVKQREIMELYTKYLSDFTKHFGIPNFWEKEFDGKLHEIASLKKELQEQKPQKTAGKPIDETEQIIKGLSGEKIESIPTFTSTDYPVYNENYLKECIKKAEPNLSKIKDVDKELIDIRGESNLDFKKKLLDFLIWYQPDNEVAEDIIDKYISGYPTSQK